MDTLPPLQMSAGMAIKFDTNLTTWENLELTYKKQNLPLKKVHDEMSSDYRRPFCSVPVCHVNVMRIICAIYGSIDGANKVIDQREKMT